MPICLAAQTAFNSESGPIPSSWSPLMYCKQHLAPSSSCILTIHAGQNAVSGAHQSVITAAQGQQRMCGISLAGTACSSVSPPFSHPCSRCLRLIPELLVHTRATSCQPQWMKTYGDKPKGCYSHQPPPLQLACLSLPVPKVEKMLWMAYTLPALPAWLATTLMAQCRSMLCKASVQCMHAAQHSCSCH